jgi:ribose/xylose/arabinose/galactoside ABC-type transport system permease subunit
MKPDRLTPQAVHAHAHPRAQAPARRLIWPFLGLGLLLLFNLVFDPTFFEITTRDGNLYGPLLTVLRFSVKVMFLAIGMTLVIATGGVDLSVGSVAAIVGALVAQLAATGAWSFPGLLVVAIGLALAAGLFNGTLVAYFGLQPIVATLILMVLGRGIALNITGGIPIKVELPALLDLGRAYFLGLPRALWVVGLFLLATALLCRRTAVGLFIEAVGDNPTASRFSGLKARRIQLLVYTFSAICAAGAALVTIGEVGRVEPDRLGQLLELDAITAVVVGGTVLTGGRFSLLGSIVGAILIQTLSTTLIRQGMPSDIAPVPKALVILAVCLLQSESWRRKLQSRFRRFRPAAAP